VGKTVRPSPTVAGGENASKITGGEKGEKGGRKKPGNRDRKKREILVFSRRPQQNNVRDTGTFRAGGERGEKGEKGEGRWGERKNLCLNRSREPGKEKGQPIPYPDRKRKRDRS